jgi:hypothetical protein
VAGKMLIKTDLARSFEADLTERLKEFEDEFTKFRGLVCLDKHYLSVLYLVHTPSDSLFTKDGKVSARSVDWDAHKLFQDVIFKCLGLDDKMVRNGQVITPVSKDNHWNYTVTLEIKDIEELKQLEKLDGDIL